MTGSRTSRQWEMRVDMTGSRTARQRVVRSGQDWKQVDGGW